LVPTKSKIASLNVVAAMDEAVVELTPAEGPVTPCGKCRQMIWEFCDDDTNVPVLMSDPLFSKVWFSTIGILLPAAFGPSVLGVSPRQYMARRAERLSR